MGYGDTGGGWGGVGWHGAVEVHNGSAGPAVPQSSDSDAFLGLWEADQGVAVPR